MKLKRWPVFLSFGLENVIHICMYLSHLELDGKLSPKTAPTATVAFGGPLKKAITPVRGLQIVSPSRVLL